MLLFIGLLILAYGLGSISCAVLVCRLLGLADPRLAGSHNPGTSNVLRVAGRRAAAYTLLGDYVKGLVPVALAHVAGLSLPQAAFVGLLAVVGHVFPVFFGFKGGKGVATALGVLTGLSWLLGAGTLLIWLLVACYSRIASLASLIALGLSPVLALWLQPQTAPVLMLMIVLLFQRHRENLQRLRQGNERRF